MKTVLVTGSGSGLGYATCLALARTGYQVFASMRDLGEGASRLKEEALKENLSIEPVWCDVTDRTSVESCMESIVDRVGHLDLLVCNAGMGYAKALEHATYPEMEQVFAVNYWGVVHSIKSALPHMRMRKQGRIIVISSIGGLVGQPLNEVYCASKFAVEGLVESLATYLTPAFGITCTLIEPGGMRSNFMATAIKNSTTGNSLIPNDDYKPIVESYLGASQKRSASGTQTSFQTTDEVAAVVVDCATCDNPPLRRRSSQWAEDFCRFKVEGDQSGHRNLQAVREQMLSLSL